MTNASQNPRPSSWHLWKEPGLTWILLLVLSGVSYWTAYLPLGDANIAVNLLIAAIMVGFLFVVLMGLKSARVILRTFACAGFFWLILMFTLTFNDYLSRYY